MNNSVLEKLQKLLALSNSSNPHEAELAMQKALEISMQHNIDLAKVGIISDKVEEGFEKDRVSVSTKFSTMGKYINSILNKHFKVSILKSGYRGQRVLWYVGKRSDIDTAKFVANFLDVTFTRLWISYKKKNNLSVKSKQSYLYGLYMGLDQKLNEKQKEVISKQDSATQNRYAIVVQDFKKELQLAVNDFFGKTRSTTQTILTHNRDALNSGISDGKNINISQPLGSSKERVLCLT